MPSIDALSTASLVSVPAITSNVHVRDGRHITGAGDEVILTCKTMESTSLEWRSMNILQLDIGVLRFTANDDVYENKSSGDFLAILMYKSVAPDNVTANLTSTLTFEAPKRYSELVIECAAGEFTNNATLYLSGMISNAAIRGVDRISAKGAGP